MIEGNTSRWTVTVEELMRVTRRPKLLATDRPDLPSRDAIVRNPKDELTTDTLRAMLRQLGLSLGEL